MKPMATYIDTPPQSPKVMTRERMKALVWPTASSDITDDMLLTAVENRVRLGRIALDGAGEG